MKVSTRHSGRAGAMLVEVLLVGTLGAILIGALCEMYLAGHKLTKRVQAQSSACQMASLGVERMAAIIERGVSAYIEADGAQVRVILPLDKDAEGRYVPGSQGGKLLYRDGDSIRLYLAGADGELPGNIVWLSRKPQGLSVWTPDEEWSLNPGTTTGRVQDVATLEFTAVAPDAITITITVTEPYSAKDATVTMTRTVYLRHNNTAGRV